jgi:hypothetical protein
MEFRDLFLERDHYANGTRMASDGHYRLVDNRLRFEKETASPKRRKVSGAQQHRAEELVGRDRIEHVLEPRVHEIFSDHDLGSVGEPGYESMIPRARRHRRDIGGAEPVEGAALLDFDTFTEPLPDLGHEIRSRRLADRDEERARGHGA